MVHARRSKSQPLDEDICTIGNYKASGPRMVLYNVIYHIPIFYFANFIVINEINTFVVIICFFVFFYLQYFNFRLLSF